MVDELQIGNMNAGYYIDKTVLHSYSDRRKVLFAISLQECLNELGYQLDYDTCHKIIEQDISFLNEDLEKYLKIMFSGYNTLKIISFSIEYVIIFNGSIDISILSKLEKFYITVDHTEHTIAVERIGFPNQDIRQFPVMWGQITDLHKEVAKLILTGSLEIYE